MKSPVLKIRRTPLWLSLPWLRLQTPDIKKPQSFDWGFLRWSVKRDSNPRPSGPKPDALPSCAIHRYISFFSIFTKNGNRSYRIMGWLTRLELATTGITIRGSTNWAIATIKLCNNRLLAVIFLFIFNQWEEKKSGRWRGIRTPDPLVPNQMRYQAALFTDTNSFFGINERKLSAPLFLTSWCTIKLVYSSM